MTNRVSSRRVRLEEDEGAGQEGSRQKEQPVLRSASAVSGELPGGQIRGRWVDPEHTGTTAGNSAFMGGFGQEGLDLPSV